MVSTSNQRENRYIYIYIVVALFSFLVNIFLNTNNNVSVADQTSNVNYSVTVEDSLSISVSSSSVVLDLNPAVEEFKSKELTVKVGTNNASGYELYINAGGTNLVKIDDTDVYIENISMETSEANFPTNRWGNKVNSNVLSQTNYTPFFSGMLISRSSIAVNEDVSAITFAAKADMNKPAGSYKLDLSFEAVVNPYQVSIADVTYMQEVASVANGGCPSSLVVGQAYPLKDSRDERTYYVARLADGNCWMLNNLRLGQDASIADNIILTPKDSDVESKFELKGKLSNGVFTYSTVDGVTEQNNNSQYYCTANYGCYYNWYTSTAGAGTTWVISGDVDYSICPKGWTLPTTENLAAIYNNYNTPAKLLVNPTSATENTNGASAPGYLMSGVYYTRGGTAFNTYGDYWSRSAHSAAYGYRMCASTSVSVNRANVTMQKYFGASLRCLLK